MHRHCRRQAARRPCHHCREADRRGPVPARRSASRHPASRRAPESVRGLHREAARTPTYRLQETDPPRSVSLPPRGVAARAHHLRRRPEGRSCPEADRSGKQAPDRSSCRHRRLPPAKRATLWWCYRRRRRHRRRRSPESGCLYRRRPPAGTQPLQPRRVSLPSSFRPPPQIREFSEPGNWRTD